MRDFGFVPDWGQTDPSPERKSERGYFPVSPVATVREATFSETIAGLLGADPSHSIEDLREQFIQNSELGQGEEASEVWDAFHSSYITTGRRGARRSSGSANEYLIPFHHEVIRRIQVGESRGWRRWFWMLMTDGDGDYATELHDEFIEILTIENPSNLIEKLAVDAAKELDTETDETTLEPTPIRPLIPELSTSLQQDLRAWIRIRPEESLSRWMQGLRDILCFHYMTYFIQAAKSLRKEYEHVENGTCESFEHSISPIYYGLADETATGTRPFATEWDNGGIQRALYDSWGRLVVQRHIIDEAYADESSVDPRPFTLSEALCEFSQESKDRIVESLTNEFPEHQQEDVPEGLDLVEFAPRFVETVRRYYTNQGSSKQSQTAYTGGYFAVKQLGQGVDRRFIETRGAGGTISSLDKPGLRLLARLFETQTEDGHIDGFWLYLRNRGIRLDKDTRERLIAQLDYMGMLQKRSDGEEAIYVQTI